MMHRLSSFSLSLRRLGRIRHTVDVVEPIVDVGAGARRIKVRPLGTVHISSFHYDKHVRYMLSVAYLFVYEGGEILPGDDMEGSEYRWWSLDELA